MGSFDFGPIQLPSIPDIKDALGSGNPIKNVDKDWKATAPISGRDTKEAFGLNEEEKRRKELEEATRTADTRTQEQYDKAKLNIEKLQVEYQAALARAVQEQYAGLQSAIGNQRGTNPGLAASRAGFLQASVGAKAAGEGALTSTRLSQEADLSNKQLYLQLRQQELGRAFQEQEYIAQGRQASSAFNRNLLTTVGALGLSFVNPLLGALGKGVADRMLNKSSSPGQKYTSIAGRDRAISETFEPENSATSRYNNPYGSRGMQSSVFSYDHDNDQTMHRMIGSYYTGNQWRTA